MFRALNVATRAGELGVFIGESAVIPVKVSMGSPQGKPSVEDRARQIKFQEGLNIVGAVALPLAVPAGELSGLLSPLLLPSGVPESLVF